MRKSYFTMLAMAAGVALSAMAAAPASALPAVHAVSGKPSGIVQIRHDGIRHGGIGIRHGGIGIRHGGPRFHRFNGPRFYAAPIYSYRHHDGCFWLKRKALNTGSRYWWRRYNECRWG